MRGPLILLQDAQCLRGIAAASVDLVLTDPPYFDNVAYGELSSFYLPWLRLLGLAPPESEERGRTLAAIARDAAAAATFEAALGRCFGEIARVLRPNGRLVFTYQHRLASAWAALAAALAVAGLRPVQVLPLLGDSPGGLHTHAGSSKWDAVFVAVRGEHPTRSMAEASPALRGTARGTPVVEAVREPPAPRRGAHEQFANRPEDGHWPGVARGPELGVSAAAVEAAMRHYATWEARLRSVPRGAFRAADRRVLYRACLVGAALGLFGAPTSEGSAVPLGTLLDEEPPDPQYERFTSPSSDRQGALRGEEPPDLALEGC